MAAEDALVLKTDAPQKNGSLVSAAIPILLALLSLAVSAFVGYSSTDKATTARIAVVENQQKNDGQRLERIESKLDDILKELRTH